MSHLSFSKKLPIKRGCVAWLGYVFIFFVLSPSLFAHNVKQIFLSLEKPGKTWEIVSTFDAAYALPEFRNDALTPQPKREWLVHLNKNEQARIQREAELYLRNTLTFTAGKTPLTYQVSFPDFDTTPPHFPELLTGGAYLTIRLHGTIPKEALHPKKTDTTHHDKIPFKISVNKKAAPDFVVATGNDDKRDYHVVSPGTTSVLFNIDPENDHTTLTRASWFDILKMGFTHVIPHGLDHLLFILGLFFMARNWRPLLSQSLTFTLAHSITLGLAASGIFQVSRWSGAWLIEPMIALSIAYIAIENLFVKKNSRHRLVIVFLFGLVHGLGFAGSLASALDQGSTNSLIALALANLGVECAQVTILSAAWIATLVWWKYPIYQKFRLVSSLLIALTGIFWFVQRIS